MSAVTEIQRESAIVLLGDYFREIAKQIEAGNKDETIKIARVCSTLAGLFASAEWDWHKIGSIAKDLPNGGQHVLDLRELAEIERTYNAPVEKVWTALTDVEQVREWYFDQVREWYFDLNEFIPKVGFEFGFVVEHEGNRYDHRCKVTEVIPQRKIAYTLRYQGHEGDSLVTIELFPDGDKTRLKLTHEGLETFPKTPAFARENFEKGWTAIIGSELKEFVERKP